MKYQIYYSNQFEQKLRRGQLGAFIDELVSLLLQKGYPERYLRQRLTVITELDRWLVHEKIILRNLTTDAIERFVQHRSTQESMTTKGEKVTLNLFLEILRKHKCIPLQKEVKKPKNKIDKIILDYEQYLIEVQGLSLSTIIYYTKNSKYFLSTFFCSKRINLNAIHSHDIMNFITNYAGKYSCIMTSKMVTSLRSLFRFLLLYGKINKDISTCILSIPNRKHSTIPKYLSSKELKILLKHSRGKTPLKVRNYAILLLLAKIGFRAVELLRLTLDDIDWKHGVINIRGKGARKTQLPLPIDVGKALIDYLKIGRPVCSSRIFFLTARPPIKPFENPTAIGAIVAHCLKNAGLNPIKKGAHLLRHTLATEYLAKGATLSEIGEILRHRQIDTTAIYAKVDFKRLETIVQAWPD